MTTPAHRAYEREAPPRSAAYDEGFHTFPISLPFAPLDVLSEYQRDFYEGWIAAARTVFGSVGSDPGWEATPHPATGHRDT